MDKLKNLQLQILEKHIASIHVCDVPKRGWIHGIRKAISMTMKQLGNRMGVTQQAI